MRNLTVARIKVVVGIEVIVEIEAITLEYLLPFTPECEGYGGILSRESIVFIEVLGDFVVLVVVFVAVHIVLTDTGHNCES